jgi:hypothetical protein
MVTNILEDHIGTSSKEEVEENFGMAELCSYLHLSIDRADLAMLS